MFWIIENESQAEKLFSSGIKDCYLEFITDNDLMHNTLSKVIAIYIQDVNSTSGHIIPIDHSEGMNSLSLEWLLSNITKVCDNIYLSDKRKALYYINDNDNLYCLKMSYYIKNDSIIDSNKYNTSAHSFFYNKYPDNSKINSIIPLAKHYEKWNKFFNEHKVSSTNVTNSVYLFYNTHIIKAFQSIECAGVSIDESTFDEYFKPRYKSLSISKGKIYSEYNMFTTVGRPANNFNGINLAALKKKNGERSSFIPENDYFVEMDFNAYHPRILASIIGYDFGDEDVHTHLAQYYFSTEEVTQEQYDEGKALTFKLLYTDTYDSSDHSIPFFNKVKELKDILWQKYNEKGYILSPVSKRKIRNVEKVSQILPYLCQTIETERNAIIINKIQELLIGKTSKLVLYTYDSFLIDFSKSDGKKLLEDIEKLLNGDEKPYPVGIKIGKNYNNMT